MANLHHDGVFEIDCASYPICEQASYLVYVPVEVQRIDCESDDPNYMEDDDTNSKELENFINSSDDEGDDIYDTTSDARLLQEINSWMQKNHASNPIILTTRPNSKALEQLSDYDDSDELLSIDGSHSSDNELKPKWSEFNEKTDLHENTELVNGIKFDTNVTFRKALIEWTIKRGYDIKYTHSDKSRVIAICKDRCGWRIHASLIQDKSCF
ncbi:unnamed protein product [Lupinus luteus]|uniref:Transposase MuDR plant domain-containing protein n=1 Tax=Lupinus luteus TaxID=3873 RepID=A0AAV1WP21_LUPLU